MFLNQRIIETFFWIFHPLTFIFHEKFFSIYSLSIYLFVQICQKFPKLVINKTFSPKKKNLSSKKKFFLFLLLIGLVSTINKNGKVHHGKKRVEIYRKNLFCFIVHTLFCWRSSTLRTVHTIINLKHPNNLHFMNTVEYIIDWRSKLQELAIYTYIPIHSRNIIIKIFK